MALLGGHAEQNIGSRSVRRVPNQPWCVGRPAIAALAAGRATKRIVRLMTAKGKEEEEEQEEEEDGSGAQKHLPLFENAR